MNPTALTITIAYCAVVAIAIVGILIIWRSTHSFEQPRTDTVDHAKLAHGEKGWFIFAVIALGILALTTLAFIPYGDNAKASGQQDVAVVGQQFAWTVAPARIRADVPVRFAITSKDVNHGFAVYNNDNVLLFQIQVQPGYTSHYVYTFTQPGRYQVVCLEFCGVGHHHMFGQFQVTAR